MNAVRGDAAWHAVPAAEVLRAFDADAKQGLSRAEAKRRLAEHGPNAIERQAGRSVLAIVAGQLRETLVLLLIVAAGMSFALGDREDALAILAIVVLNAALGARQEYMAERAMEALARLAAPLVTLRRDGEVVELPVEETVPGDLVLLKAGDAVAADGRLVEAAGLSLDESALTGESVPSLKDAAAELGEDEALGDRRTMVYRGATVTTGRGVALATATGMRTELGRVANLLHSVRQEATPLQRRLARLGTTLVWAAVAIAAVVFGVGLARGEEAQLMFLTAVSLAVAAAPEGLPAVVTIALALGARRMLVRNALIRRLPSVETLGSVTVICSDKTGTLTENRMKLRELALPDDGGADDPRRRLGLIAAALCNDAAPGVAGDPTETALADAAAEARFDKAALEELAPRVAEAPFDSSRMRMATAHRTARLEALPRPAEYAVFAKGALDAILDVATGWESSEGVAALDEAARARILTEHDRMAGQGMRVLALAWRPAESAPETLEADLVFIGLAGLLDPPRPEAAEAVRKCHAAGIRTVMITGDHPKTACAVAAEVGMGGQECALAGREIAAASEQELEEIAARTNVYARVSPEDKLRIVTALQARGEVVAMTGDGVNDAPALKRADIGVAMGITGTDVAKEASDMVLRDDNFATIVAAVEEGRVIYDNIRKFVRYLLSANCGELWVMLAGPLAGMPTPLTPLQILWMNLITDGPPALALGVEPAENDVMQRPPTRPDEGVFSRGVGRDIVWVGLTMGLIALAVGWFYWAEGLPQWQTMLFTTLTLSQMALALAARSEHQSFFRQGPLSNLPLTLAVLASTGMQLAVVYAPPLQRLFGVVPLSPSDLAVAVAAGACTFVAVEAEKAIGRARRG